MDMDYYLGIEDGPNKALLGGQTPADDATKQGFKRKIAVAASTLGLAALAVGAYVAAPSGQVAPSQAQVLMSNQYGDYGDLFDARTSAIDAGVHRRPSN